MWPASNRHLRPAGKVPLTCTSAGLREDAVGQRELAEAGGDGGVAACPVVPHLQRQGKGLDLTRRPPFRGRRRGTASTMPGSARAVNGGNVGLRPSANCSKRTPANQVPVVASGAAIFTRALNSGVPG